MPIVINFEPIEGFALGNINGQNQWSASQGSAAVSSAFAYSGTQSLELAPGSPVAIAGVSFGSTAGEGIEFCDFYSLPVAETSIASSTLFSATAAEFGFAQSNGVGVLEFLQGNGSGGGTWVATPFTISLGAGNQSASWVRLTARLDFGAKTWDIYSNGTLVASSIPFTNNSATYFSAFQVLGDASTASFVDAIYIGSSNPLFEDTNNNGIPDSWEIQYLGNLNYSASADPGGVGRTILLSYQEGLSPWPTPTVASGLQAWYRAAVGVVNDANNNVTQWTDLSGSGFHVYQTALASEPLLVAAGMNGNPAVQFTPQQLLASSAMDNIEGSGSDVTVIAVIDPSATQGSGATIYSWGTDGTVNFGLSSNSTNSYLLYWGSASGSVDGPAAVATAGLPQIISEVKSGTSASAYVNGVLSGTTTVPATIAAAPATLAMGNGANPSFGFAGQIAELLVYNRALSNSERQSIEAGLTTLYVGSTGGIPNTWLLEYFGTTNVNVNTDYDGNGQTVTQDYTAGFDPVDFFNGRAFAILPSGASNTFTYDLSGRLIKTSYSNGVNFSLTNDPAGNITAVSNYGPIVQWRSANGLPADGTGIGADSEILGNDGIPNLAKYAFGLSPFATFTGNCPVVSITGLSGYLRLAYTRPDPAPSDIVYTVQVSGDGINWSSGSGATLNVSTTVNDGIATVVVQDATPIGSPSFGRQIRLAIQRVPQP